MAGLSYFNLNVLNDTDKLKELLIRSNGDRKILKMNDNNENILHIYCKDKRCKKSGSTHGINDNSINDTIKIFYDCAPFVFSQKTKLEKQTPLHYAMKSGNIQKAKAILAVFAKANNFEYQSEIFNITDYNGMRPIDLLCIRQDSEHKKNFLEAASQDPDKQDNCKIIKKFEVYTWKTYDAFDSDTRILRHEVPKRVQFLEVDRAMTFDPTSITHVEAKENYYVALTDDGKVYSWGIGEKGRLGTGSHYTCQFPTRVQFSNPNNDEVKSSLKEEPEFDLEYEKINAAIKKIKKFGNTEEIMEMHTFIQRFVQKNQYFERTFTSDNTRERRYSEEEYFDMEGFEENGPQEVVNYEEVKLVTKNTLNTNILLSKMDKVFVTQISCSENHTLICTNTGSVYGWGCNEYSQIGFESNDLKKCFISKPKKIFGSCKNGFIERVAAGKNHSLALSNEGGVHGWGSNLESQLGLNKVDYPIVHRPTQLQSIISYSGSKRNGVKMIRANDNSSLFLTESRKCYVSNQNSTGFVQVNIDSGSVSNAFLGPNYSILIDNNRSIHFCYFSDKNSKFSECNSVNIMENSNFIGFCCNADKIWALNSKRQVYIADIALESKGNFEKKISQKIEFKPYNEILNIMKISSSGTSNAAVKMVCLSLS